LVGGKVGRSEHVLLILLPLAIEQWNLPRATKHWNLPLAIEWDLIFLHLVPFFFLKGKFTSFGVLFSGHNFLFEFSEYLFSQPSLGGEE
jgi:hypothetical protein